MRTRNSIVNSIFAVISYIILFFGPFIIIPLIKKHIGTDVLGLEKTFVDIVYFIRLGIIYGIYKLYKPIAEKNIKSITIFLSFYRKLLAFAGIFIFILGLICLPFVPKITESVDNSKLFFNVQTIFMLYVLDVSLTYLFGHKRALIIADQKNYVTTISRTICRVLMFFFQAISIIFFKSFSLYVIIKVCSTLGESILINIYYKKFYSHIPTKTDLKMAPSEKLDLFRTLKAVLCHKFSEEALFSVSTFVMTTRLTATVTGIYYPYAQIVSGLITITAHVFNAVVSSFGNYLAEKTSQEVYKIYQKIYFLNFLIFSFFSTAILCLSSTFVSIWVGADSILPLKTTILLTLYFYLLGMRQSINMVKSSAGIFRPDRFLVVLEPILNLGLAWFLSHNFGINGILIANILTILLIPFLVQPFLVYKNVFKMPHKLYYKKYFMYIFLTFLECSFSYFLCNYLLDFQYKLLINLSVCLIIPNLLNYAIFKDAEELIYLKSLLNRIKNKFYIKIKKLKS